MFALKSMGGCVCVRACVRACVCVLWTLRMVDVFVSALQRALFSFVSFLFPPGVLPSFRCECWALTVTLPTMHLSLSNRSKRNILACWTSWSWRNVVLECNIKVIFFYIKKPTCCVAVLGVLFVSLSLSLSLCVWLGPGQGTSPAIYRTRDLAYTSSPRPLFMDGRLICTVRLSGKARVRHGADSPNHT